MLGALMLVCELLAEGSTKIFSRNPQKRCVKKMCLWFKSLYVQLALGSVKTLFSVLSFVLVHREEKNKKREKLGKL